MLLSTVLVGPVFDLGYVRLLVGLGAFMVVFGMMMTSISTDYYQVFLAQGVCVGLGGIMKKDAKPIPRVSAPSMRNRYRQPDFPPTPRRRNRPVAMNAPRISAR